MLERDIKPLLQGINKGKLYTADEAAEVVGVSPSLIYRAAVEQGDLGHVRMGGRKGIRIPGVALIRWVESRWGSGPTHALGTTKIDGSKVRRYRKTRSMSLDLLATRSGVSRSTIARIESGTIAGRCKTETARSIADALEIKPRTIGASLD